MKNSAHPSLLFSSEEVDRIRQQSFINEQQRELTSDLVRLIEEKRWLRVLQPKAVGGLEWDFPRVVRLFEALAWADGNLGWCVNLGAGANMFAGYLEESVAKQIFDSDRIWCAGSGAVSGIADIVDGGYVLNGKWKYASGSAHASHFTANCWIRENGAFKRDAQNTRIFQSFIFSKEQVSVLDTWHVTGLQATSSHDFEVLQCFVPQNQVFSLLQASSFAQGPLFRFPFDVLAVVNMAIVPMGMALHFLDLFKDLMEQKKPLNSNDLLKENVPLQEKYNALASSFAKERESMYILIESMWQEIKLKGSAEKEVRNQVVNAAREAARHARNLVFELFPYCGMSIIFEPGELNKVWRDLSVACQHYLLR